MDLPSTTIVSLESPVLRRQLDHQIELSLPVDQRCCAREWLDDGVPTGAVLVDGFIKGNHRIFHD